MLVVDGKELLEFMKKRMETVRGSGLLKEAPGLSKRDYVAGHASLMADVVEAFGLERCSERQIQSDGSGTDKGEGAASVQSEYSRPEFGYLHPMWSVESVEAAPESR